MNIIEEIKQYLQEEIKRQEKNFGEDDHSSTVVDILEKIEAIEIGFQDGKHNYDTPKSNDFI